MSESSKEALAAAEKWYGWVPPDLTGAGRAVTQDLAKVIQGVVDEVIQELEERCTTLAVTLTTTQGVVCASSLLPKKEHKLLMDRINAALSYLEEPEDEEQHS